MPSTRPADHHRQRRTRRTGAGSRPVDATLARSRRRLLPLRDSGLEWTVSRPPKLTDRPLTGRYGTEWSRNIRGGFSVPRGDVAPTTCSPW
ncbi:NAD(P)H-binding protein [Streptomyces sp. NBC_00019]|uniref:NAD(P)H-binding protein n=1 Tax=Streptomyces sp. NBC_00019 TaxID=2975623 RepID=UPI002F916AE3